MPVAQRTPEPLPSVAERKQDGHDLRKTVPRGSHAEWHPPPTRRDPVEVLIDSGRHRIPALLPIRYARMRTSPFTFLRGAAAIMAADLANTPTSGLFVQACGDCHLMNFGAYASPEGTPVFDTNDFDETLPAPFEWDIKRLATSFAVAARSQGMAEKTCRNLARSVTLAYRMHMAELIKLAPLDIWRNRIDLLEALASIENPKLREREGKRLHGAVESSRRGYPRIIERTRDGLRIREKPPLIFRLGTQHDELHEMAARTAFESYKKTLSEERHRLLDRYRLVDVAFKVVGIGSVGTFCALGLFATPDEDTLLLQIKEAQDSVLAPYAGPSAYKNQGERVVVGQRMMQAVADAFLGWTRDKQDDRHCYVRLLKDSRLAAVGLDLEEELLPYYAQLCGRTLARAHARSGDPARIVGYMGSGGAFDSAIADFALAYADQTDRDWRLFNDAIKTGWIEARAA